MTVNSLSRTDVALVAVSALNVVVINAVELANAVRVGQGIKCNWLLISSVNGSSTYQEVCGKGV